MTKQLLLLYFVINIVAFVTCKMVPLEGYYWHPYKGYIPANAFSAGYNSNGTPIYIGQVFVENKIIPGIIYKDDDKIYYEWDEQAQSAEDNIRILCAHYPQNLEWIPTTIYDMNKLDSDSLIKGGYQQEFDTYIGRVQKNGNINVGKVVCRSDQCLALYAVNNKTKNVEYHEYEILSYSFNNIVISSGF